MLFIERLLYTVLVIQVCQTLTIYQQLKVKPKISNIKPVSLNSSSEILGPMKHMNFQQPGHGNAYSAQQHQLNNPWTAPSPKLNPNTHEQPVAADDFEGDELHNTESHTEKEPLFINYHNEIYHLKSIERASPYANNRHWENQRLNVRKQRNLRENHDNKLIEQNMKDTEYVKENGDRVQQSTKAEALKRSSKQPSTMTTSRPSVETSHEIRYLHNIFLNYPKPHHVNFGHVELSPVLFEKHFESQKEGNRYKGEILWLDNTGGFAQHSWDLAQGRL